MPKGKVLGLDERHCDNCPRTFTPSQPGQRFCSPNCRKEFNFRGGSFSKLKPVIDKAVRDRIVELNPTDLVRLESIERRLQDLERFRRSLTAAVVPDL